MTNKDKKIEEFLCIGTSKGEIYNITITKNNSVLINTDRKFTYKDGSHAITSLAGDLHSESIMAGTHT
jgi:hypothetical protein